MRLRPLLAGSLIAVVAAGSLSPALAKGKPKSKPAPIVGSYTATALPDPTGDMPAANKGKCASMTPTGRTTHEFKVPAAGTLTVSLNNKLDWSLDVRNADGVLGDSDGGSPVSAESVEVAFKKKDTVVIGACNLTGEPSVTVSYTFTYK
ncbi:MAG: hypothetical protein M3N21_01605 [Actinomycetota bacterium]|nr:hypothetical protein [Actinomycetota bacterium]